MLKAILGLEHTPQSVENKKRGYRRHIKSLLASARADHAIAADSTTKKNMEYHLDAAEQMRASARYFLRKIQNLRVWWG